MKIQALLHIASLDLALSGFQPGRVDPGRFEYSKLNRWMDPDEAASVCESDWMCGGFTYKGGLTVATFQIFFFHYVANILLKEDGKETWDWTSYRVNRPFIYLSGRPRIHGSPLSNFSLDLKEVPEEAAKVCLELDQCVGLIQHNVSGLTFSMEQFELQTMEPDPDWKTIILVAANTTMISDKHVMDHLDLCCPATPYIPQIRISNVTINEQIFREPCNISSEEFARKYVTMRRPVILEGCLDPGLFPTDKFDKTAEFGGHTFDSILHNMFERPGNITDKMAYRPRLRREIISYLRSSNTSLDLSTMEKLKQLTLTSTEDLRAAPSWTHDQTPNDGEITLEQVLEMRQAGVIRTFLRLSSLVTDTDCYRKFAQKDGTLGPGHEACMVLEGLWKPSPLPSDLYAETKYDNDLAWMILSARNSGSQVHVDPDMMGAWNLLMLGRKWWVVLPAFIPGKPACDIKCSPGSDDMSHTYPWFQHILPQIRNKSLYGQKVQEFVQMPGEVLYLPHGMPHTIHNLDDTVAVTENYLFSDAVPHVTAAVAQDRVRHWVNWPQSQALHKLYMQHTDKEIRAKMRSVYRRVEAMAQQYPEQC